MAAVSTVLNELQALHYLIDFPETVPTLDRNYFLTPQGKDIYESLVHLYRKAVTFTPEHVLQEANTRNDTVDQETIADILSTEYDSNSWGHYCQVLKENFAKEEITTRILKEGLESVTTKGRLDLDALEDLVRQLQDSIQTARGQSVDIVTLSQMFDVYENVLMKRQEGTYSYKTSCALLDKHLVGFVPGEITIIFGSTGVGKSTFARYLINRHINQRIPCLDVSLEMSTIATMDRTLAARTRIPFSVLNSKSGEEIDDAVIAAIREERAKMEGIKTFYHVENASLTMPELEKLIIEAKIRAKAKHMTVFIDLFTMLKELSGNKPNEYERAMDDIHKMARRLNVHFVLVIQAIQKTLEAHSPSSLAGLGVFRPSLASIKNSSAFAERARTVLGVFREKYYATRFFPDDPLTPMLDDILEVSVLKQSNGPVGARINYLHDEGLFRLYAVPQDYEPLTGSSLAKGPISKEVPSHVDSSED